MRHVASARWLVSISVALALAPPVRAYEQQVQQLAHDLAAQLGARDAKQVAVVDFTDLRGDVNELGRFLAEELSVALNQAAEGFQVIDRTRLQVVFAEHRLGATGLIAPEDAKRLGQLVGADVLVSATMTPFGESVRLSVKALDTETAALVASARSDVPRTGAVEELMGRGMGYKGQGRGGLSQPGRKVEPVTMRDFAFEVYGCAVSGTTAECVVLVQNQSTDRELIVFKTSRLYDDVGNQYHPQLLRIANARVGPLAGDIRRVVVQEVPTQIGLTFEDISAAATRASLLNLSLYADGDYFQVSLRDFPLGIAAR